MHPMRRIAPFLLAGALAAVPALTLAHTELASADPADGSTVSDPPDEVVLTFEGEVGDGSTFVVLDPSGAEIGSGALDLEVADRNVLRGEVEVEAAGEYTVRWSVVGEDEHPVEGEVTFTYAPEGGTEASTPDTALPAGTGSPVALLGLLLVVLAVTITARRAIAARA
jgi:methionine-rich copper-binding protein CopC